MHRKKRAHNFQPISNIIVVLITAVIIYIFIEGVIAQIKICEKTKWNTRRDHACPIFTRESFTLENVTSDGTSKFSKFCCRDRGALEYTKAAARSCRTTRCVLSSEPFNRFKFPCTTLAKVIVDRKYIVNEESLRDECVEETTKEKGVAAVCCPPNTLDSLLVSAYGAEVNEFPHAGRLQSGNEICGATVYNKDFIISAAHCVTEVDGLVKDPNETHVVLGSNIATIDSITNIFPVKKIIVHEDFSLRRTSHEFLRLPFPPKRIFNDVAVLQLGKSIDFATQPHIRALPIAPPNFNPAEHADEAVIIGWGTTDNGLTTHHLQKANLVIRQDEQCFKPLLGGGPYANMKEFSNQLLCVGGILNGQFSPVAGRGDSGGPAICRGADGYAVHCGITSFGGDGDSCSENIDEYSCRPSAYADVSYFRDWIIKHAGEQEKEGLLKMKLYGDPVPQGQYEHQVLVTSTKGPACGGTLVSKDTVVTAGHCVLMDDKRPKMDVTVTIRNGSTFKARRGGITGTKMFERYNLLEKLNHRKSGRKTFLTPPYIEDIAVVKLDKSVPIEDKNLPKLPTSSQVPGKDVHAVELSIPLNNHKPRKKRLTQRKFRILDSKDCQRRIDRFKVMGVEAKFDSKKTFCGVEEYSGGGICDRQLGGGLICRKTYNNGNNQEKIQDGGNGSEQVLCGIQTFRLCDMSMPSAFVNVGAYKDMIEKVIKSR